MSAAAGGGHRGCRSAGAMSGRTRGCWLRGLRGWLVYGLW